MTEEMQEILSFETSANIGKVNNLSREDTITLLEQGKLYATNIEYFYKQINDLTANLDEKEKEKEDREANWYHGTAAIVFIVFAIVSIIIFAEMSMWFDNILLAFGIPIVLIVLLWKFLFWPVTKKLWAWADQKQGIAQANFTEANIAPLKASLNKAYENFYKNQCNRKLQWGTRIFGKEFFNSASLAELLGYIKSGRADTLKEAINLMDQNMHRANMENMQRIIQDAALATAEASAETAQKAAEAATAAKLSALFNYGTYRNTKKIRKSLR